jgi:uncharacterized protein YcgL (UPF0745 family)
MIYNLKLKSRIDDRIFIDKVEESNLVPKWYYDLKETFIEHHNCMGMDLEEAEDLFNDSELKQVKKWMKKSGYEV